MVPSPRPSFVRSLAVALVVTAAGASGCAASGGGDEAEATGAAQSGVQPDAIATIEANPEGGGPLARVGPSRWALVGEHVAELEIGRRYKVSLATTTEPRSGAFEVRRLVAFSRVVRLVGTLSDDAQDPAVMRLESLHGKTYALYGDTVTGYRDVRVNLPNHDYSKTLFTVNAVADLGGAAGSRWQWLDYTPVARYKCTQSDAAQTHLDLVDVKPDESLLDGFITTPLGGREVRYGAHAECKRDGAAYACAFDSVGSPWGAARFTPAGDARFEVTVERADEAKTKIAFGCETVTRASATALSED